MKFAEAVSKVIDKVKKLAQIIKDDDKVTADDWEKFDQDLFRFNESNQFAWYGACFGQTTRILTLEIPTACVGYKDNGIVIAFNPRFLEQLTFYERCFVYCHEIEHIIRSHISLIEDYPERAEEYNISADSLINEALLDYNNIWSKQDVPTWVPVGPNAEYVKQELARRGKTKCEMIDLESIKELIANANLAGGQASSKLPTNLDTKTYYRDYTTEDIVKYIPRNSNEDENNDLFEEACGGMYGDMGEFFNDGSVPDEVKDALAEQMINEASQGRGSAPGHLASYLDKIKDKTNRDWRMMTRGLGRSTKIKITRSWVKWNKRNPSLGMPLKPGRTFQSLPKILVMADTSGSIGDHELMHFIKEINGLCNRCIIDMAWVDAHFDEDDPDIFHRNIKNAHDFQKRAQNPVGRGGTYFDEFYKYALRHYGEYQHLLILTDGYADCIPSRLVPGQQLSLMTPIHSEQFVNTAREHGFKVAIIEDTE